jgi:cytochrome c5
MSRNLLPVVILLSAVAMPLVVRAATLSELKPVKIDLPDSDRMFPAGPGADAMNNNCLACHSAGMVLNQPELSKQAWAAEVNKMINAYKAPVAPEDVEAIVEYLSRTKGAE